MTKFNVLLLLAVIASALLLVKTAYEARTLFTSIHRAEVEAVRLAGEQKRLEADRQLQATNLRVERTARERLKMSTATPAVTMYESRAAGAAAGATP
ncbi:MAG: cell division protein FtsL [Aquabacterium sp.]|nr:cell division protein FtsL [Aquabacterium sp.]